MEQGITPCGLPAHLPVFDAHAHLGEDVVFDVATGEERLLRACRSHGVSGALIQPFICRPDVGETRRIHDRIHALCLAHPRALYGMASVNPYLPEEEYFAEASRCVRELGFRGIKLATTAHGVKPSNRAGMRVFEAARALGVAVMVHTGGGDFGNPAHLLAPVRAYPDLPVVIAHGGGEYQEEAIQLAACHDNVCVEPSWVSILGLKAMLRRLGPDKMMFSSDMPENLPVALAAFAALGAGEPALEKMLWKTACRVFSIGDFNSEGMCGL